MYVYTENMHAVIYCTFILHLMIYYPKKAYIMYMFLLYNWTKIIKRGVWIFIQFYNVPTYKIIQLCILAVQLGLQWQTLLTGRITTRYDSWIIWIRKTFKKKYNFSLPYDGQQQSLSRASKAFNPPAEYSLHIFSLCQLLYKENSLPPLAVREKL